MKITSPEDDKEANARLPWVKVRTLYLSFFNASVICSLLSPQISASAWGYLISRKTHVGLPPIGAVNCVTSAP